MSTNIGSILETVTTTAIRQFAAACRESDKPMHLPSHIVEQLVGSRVLLQALLALEELERAGWSAGQVAFLVDQIAQERERAESPTSAFDLVLSGPDLDRVNVRDTFAVVNELFVRAHDEVVLVGYAVHNGHVLFQRLAERIESTPDIRVRMYLDISRRPGDTSLSDQIIRRFSREFFTRHWPWERRPELYYDTRSLNDAPEHRSSLHAKCVIVDRSAVLITSANFTSAAQERNIEAGTLIENRPCVEKLLTYFDGLCASGIIRQVPSYYGCP